MDASILYKHLLEEPLNFTIPHKGRLCYISVNCLVNLRNEFDFWKVHGIMNTSGLLQSK